MLIQQIHPNIVVMVISNDILKKMITIVTLRQSNMACWQIHQKDDFPSKKETFLGDFAMITGGYHHIQQGYHHIGVS
jgi:hypothetical protein